MASFRATIVSPLAPAEAFGRMAAFERVPEWDPATSASERIGAAPGPGTAYDVTTRFGRRTHVIRYDTTEFEAPTRFVLQATLPNGIRLRDTVTVAPDAGPGSVVTYEARIIPSGVWRLAAPILQLIFTRIGAKALPGMRRYLDAV